MKNVGTVRSSDVENIHVYIFWRKEAGMAY